MGRHVPNGEVQIALLQRRCDLGRDLGHQCRRGPLFSARRQCGIVDASRCPFSGAATGKEQMPGPVGPGIDLQRGGRLGHRGGLTPRVLPKCLKAR